MYSVIALAVVSFVICAAVTPLVRKILLHWGILDAPDGRRKLHGRAIPRAGGLALPVGYLTAFAVLLLLPFEGAKFLREHLDSALAVLPAAGIVFLTGLADDIFGLRPAQKLVGQAAAAVWAYAAGVRIPGLSELLIANWISFVLTVLWLLLCTNAFNLIDGVDGLTAGAGFLAAVTMMVAAYLQHNVALMVATAPLAGALLGILIYNIAPASIFMGDCGSLTVGFMLGCFGVIWSQKSATMFGMAAPVIALGLPLLDTSLAVVRRFLRLRPVFGGDRAHIHHRLLDRGLTPARVSLVLYGVCGIAAAFSLVVNATQGQFAGLVVVVFCVGAWLGIGQLRYAEFQAARNVLFQRFRRVLDSELSAIGFERLISGATTLEECWKAIVEAADEFGFADVRLSMGSEYFHRTLKPIDPIACWSFRIPLSESDYIEFRRPVRAEFPASAAVLFFDLARTSIRTGLARFNTEPRVTATRPLFAEARAE